MTSPETAIFQGALFGFELCWTAMPGGINLLRSPCAYPRGKTTGYYGAEKQNRRATLNIKNVLSARQERGEYKFKNQPQQLMFCGGFSEFHVEQELAVNRYR